MDPLNAAGWHLDWLEQTYPDSVAGFCLFTVNQQTMWELFNLNPDADLLELIAARNNAAQGSNHD